MKFKINYKRLAWIIFILLYSALFFYNCLSPYRNFLFSYFYTMVLITWLCKEYYQKKLFFQPNSLPPEAHNYLLRGLFALFFYSAFVFGITTIVWWHQYRISNTPFVPMTGILILGYSIHLRETSFKIKGEMHQAVTRFYLSIALLIFSMALGYDSYFLLLYGFFIGLPLILLQMFHYKRVIQSE
ncbi:MAG: hypothetical protein ABIL70_03485 [candidate division WOR-3 bacterium]